MKSRSVQGGSTLAWPSIRVKSSLTGRGLSRRLAWRTVCLDQSTEGWTGRHAGTQIGEAALKSWVLRISPLLYLELYCCDVYVDIFHFTDLYLRDCSTLNVYSAPIEAWFQIVHKSLPHLWGEQGEQDAHCLKPSHQTTFFPPGQSRDTTCHVLSGLTQFSYISKGHRVVSIWLKLLIRMLSTGGSTNWETQSHTTAT